MAKPDYEIGYCKPPKNSQFKKGHSGNPEGRPKGSKNFATMINRIIHQKISINENGHKRTVTKLEACVMQVANRALSADIKCLQMLFQLQSIIERAEITDHSAPLFNQDNDLQTLQRLMQRTHLAQEPDPEN